MHAEAHFFDIDFSVKKVQARALGTNRYPGVLSPDERCTRVLMAQFQSPLWIHTGGHMRFDPFDWYEPRLRAASLGVVLPLVLIIFAICGRGSLVIKVTDLWQTCHEFKPGTTEDPLCTSGPMHIKYVEPQTSSHWCGTTRGLLTTDHVILNHGQVTWRTPELASPLLTTTPHLRDFDTELKENIDRMLEKAKENIRQFLFTNDPAYEVEESCYSQNG
ncbi:hypothetical protein TNCV_1800631 [Trichonephila clavipes]|nr:hypothetical protein TNCV_1800631 [Trichonephila clavipes]